MDALESDWTVTKEATSFLVGIQPGDKLCSRGDVVYATPAGIAQSVWRTLAGESRDTTYRYVESAVEAHVAFMTRLLEHIRFHGRKDSKVHAILEECATHAAAMDEGLSALATTYAGAESIERARARLASAVRLFTSGVSRY